MAWDCAVFGFVLAILGSSVRVSSATWRDDKCPMSCQCTNPAPDSMEWQVKCGEKKYWGIVPPLPRNTSYLKMHDCNLTILRNHSFTRTGGMALETLTLSENSLSSIEIDAFQNLGNLRFLTLSKNQLTELKNNTFSSLLNVTDLNLDINQFRVIPSSNICLMKNLHALNVNRNNLTSVKFHSCFGKLIHLFRVDLSENPVKELIPEDFYALRNVELKEVFLTRLSLTSLPTDIFKYLRYLKILSLLDNQFIQLSLGSLKQQFHLETLILKDNKLRGIPRNIVAKMPYIKELHLEGNEIQNCLFGDEFENVTNLRRLDISRNPLEKLQNESFVGLGQNSSLRELILSECKLKEIEAEAFTPLKSIEYLKLDSNPLNESTLRQAFYGLRFAKNLTQLYLGGIPLKFVNIETFKHLEDISVRQLYLDGSYLKYIPSKTFVYLKKLEYLKLSGNDIQGVSETAFAQLQHLESLDLSTNKLFDIPTVTSEQVPALQVLNLNKNEIEYIEEYSLKGYSALKTLLLDSNNIRSIAKRPFLQTPYLETLSLESNKISVLKNEVFSGVPNLRLLVIKNNDLNTFESHHVFANLTELKELDLSKNMYLSTSIKENFRYLFKSLTKLTHLYLVNTGLENIPIETFQNLTELTLLSLATNEITYWSPELLMHQTKLKHLFFTNNKLITVSKESVEQLTSLKELGLQNNMFSCECDLQWFTSWIRSGTFVYVNDLGSLFCKTPAKKDGQKLVDLRLEEECMSWTVYYISFSLLLSHMIVVTVATITYRFRYYIKYWRHLVRTQRAMKEHMGEESFVFDAFVSYTYQDQKWVIKELLHKVEKEANIKLCLHQRNWFPGSSIPANIVNSIKKSRKTVLVLSNAYARSHWCELEMTIAQQKILKSQRDVVVPILLEPIQKRNFTEQMVCLFATQTCVKWPQINEKKQRRFWRKLIQMLRATDENVEYDEDNKEFLTSVV